METEKEFSELIREDLLIWFCRHHGYPTDGFDSDTLRRVSEHDAKWFLDALTTEAVVRDGAVVTTKLSAAKEQIVWPDGRSISPRPLTIWAEPVITIEAACWLHTEFGWPKQLIGLQSHERAAFDLIAYDAPRTPRVAAEVKKTDQEIDFLIEAMAGYLSHPPLDEEPKHDEQRNAYRKVVALRRIQAPLLWALGPNGYGQLFRVEQAGEQGIARLEKAAIEELLYRKGET